MPPLSEKTIHEQISGKRALARLKDGPENHTPVMVRAWQNADSGERMLNERFPGWVFHTMADRPGSGALPTGSPMIKLDVYKRGGGEPVLKHGGPLLSFEEDYLHFVSETLLAQIVLVCG
jgi:hypothetical protein